MSADLASARLEWERAHRELLASVRDQALQERVHAQVEAISAELRRRVGGTYTLRELAEEYVVADAWAREVLAEEAAPGWSRTVSLAEGAAFYFYARGAVDYAP